MSASRKQPLFRTPPSTLYANELFSTPQNAKDMLEPGLCGRAGSRPAGEERQGDRRESSQSMSLLSTASESTALLGHLLQVLKKPKPLCYILQSCRAQRARAGGTGAEKGAEERQSRVPVRCALTVKSCAGALPWWPSNARSRADPCSRQRQKRFRR